MLFPFLSARFKEGDCYKSITINGQQCRELSRQMEHVRTRLVCLIIDYFVIKTVNIQFHGETPD